MCDSSSWHSSLVHWCAVEATEYSKPTASVLSGRTLEVVLISSHHQKSTAGSQSGDRDSEIEKFFGIYVIHICFSS